jgi:hypothetical protein
MLLILIPTVWLAIVAFFVILCQMAAQGDAALTPAVKLRHDRLGKPGPNVGEDLYNRVGRGHASHDHRLGGATLTVGRGLRSRSTRGRRPGCVAGS